MKRLLLAGSLLFFAGCKTVLSFGVHKDWAVDGYPLNSASRYNPDLRTNAELRIEKDWSKKGS